MNDFCGQSDQKFGYLAVFKSEIFHVVLMLNFIIIMVWVEVPLLVVGVWSIVCSTVEGFICWGIVDCYGCHSSVNQRFLIWLLLCFSQSAHTEPAPEPIQEWKE